MNKTNPFIDVSFPPNWKAMNTDLANEAIALALEKSKANIEQIKTLADDALTYENCISAFDSADEPLEQVWTFINHLQSLSDSKQLRDIINTNIERVSNFSTSVLLDELLYQKISTYAKSASNLEHYQDCAIKEILLMFKANGATLGKADKLKLKDIETQLALKTQKFSENVLDATNEYELYITDEAQLDGLPEYHKDVAKQKASDKGKAGQWLFTLHRTSMFPAMKYCKSEFIRQTLWRESGKVARQGKFSNYDLIQEIIKLRDDKAKLFKKDNFADYILEERMAKSGNKALDFINELSEKVVPYSKKEWSELTDFLLAQKLIESPILKPWDSSYFTEKLRLAKYDFDEQSLKEYFMLENVMKGLFEICNRLFGIEVLEIENEQAWDSDVKTYKIIDADKQVLGVFYTDFYPRETKRAGAWMNLLMSAKPKRPALGVICANVSLPTKEKPALLTYEEVQTIFHEFGHLIHFFMMDSKQELLRNVAWDYVELPSQLLENWVSQEEALNIFAKNWQSGEVLGGELLQKFKSSQKFMGANFCVRQLSLAKIDLLIHIHPELFIGKDIEAVAKEELAIYRHKFTEYPPSILAEFTHIFGDSVGYAAGYYSYKWAEVLDADVFSKFLKEGIFNKKLGKNLRDKILKLGLEKDHAEAFADFMGREPSSEAMLKRSISGF